MLPGQPRPQVFVETGTWRGDLAASAAKLFRQTITVELSAHYWWCAAERFLSSTVTPIFGDSALIIPMLAEIIKEPVIWYLDAHFIQGSKFYTTQASSNPLPLWDELKAIGAKRREELVIVDDYRDFGIEKYGWQDVVPENLLKALGTTMGQRFDDQFAMLTSS